MNFAYEEISQKDVPEIRKSFVANLKGESLMDKTITDSALEFAILLISGISLFDISSFVKNVSFYMHLKS